MAEIYLATAQGPEGFTKVVALKRLLPHLAERPKIISMFLEEARIAATLHHPHIVQIFDLVQDVSDHFICMEYLPGKDLAAVLAKCREDSIQLPIEVVAHLGCCVAQGLDFAHRQARAEGSFGPIVHGDVSPSNVVVTFVGEVKIIDFGIARVAEGADICLPGSLPGKPAYLSPEQITEGRSDARSDIFALGILLYELLTGERLFRRETRDETLRAILEDPLPDPRKLRPELPQPLVELVTRALERDPERRFQSAQEIQLALEKLLIEYQWLPTSARLAAFLESLYGRNHTEMALAVLPGEPTGTATASAQAEQPRLDLGIAAVPLVAERNLRRERGKQLVRVVGEVPAALMRAGQELVAVPANLVRFASHWTRRRLVIAAAAVGLVGFAAGIYMREIGEATLGNDPKLEEKASAERKAPGRAEETSPDRKRKSAGQGPKVNDGERDAEQRAKKKSRPRRAPELEKKTTAGPQDEARLSAVP
jgi:hypothetical protein